MLLEALSQLPGGASPWGLIAWFSLVITLVALAVLRLTTSPDRVARARNRAVAHLMEFRLYQHEWTMAPRTLARMLLATSRYLLLWIMPLVVLTIILWPVFAEAVLRFQYRSFCRGETITVRAVVRPQHDIRSVPLEWLPESDLEMDGLPFRSWAEREVVWRLRAKRPGQFVICVGEKNGAVEIPVMVEQNGVRRLCTAGTAADRVRWGQPLGIAPWNAAIIEQIYIDYPAREWRLGNVRIHWALACFMLCLMTGVVLKPVFGVAF